MRFFGRLITAAGLVAVVAGSLTACGSGSARECEDALTVAATSVQGVSAAEFTCKRSFGNPSQTGKVTIVSTTEPQAIAVMEKVLRAFADSAALGDAMVVYTTFTTENGGITVTEGAAGFNGTPSIRDLRRHYDIEPS